MIKLVDLVYYSHTEITDPLQVLQKHSPSIGFANFLKDKVDIHFIKHLNYEGNRRINDVEFAFFKRRSGFLQIPFTTHRYIKSLNPDLVIIEGLIFPVQLIALKFALDKKCRIIVQHHGELPFKGIKKIFQKIADKFIDAYLFTSLGNAAIWFDKKIIRDKLKCYEVLEASTDFEKQDKLQAKLKCGFTGSDNFLWVGRLNSNKDPLTVLEAFGKYFRINPGAKLYMIYQSPDMVSEIKNLIDTYKLKDAVILKGKVPHAELAYWYSAADFYVSASYKEGSGYALLEAMACGCIPVVTQIPSFKKITANGRYGFLFSPGSAGELLHTFRNITKIDREEYSQNVVSYFNKGLSFKKIADDLYLICKKLIA